MEDKKMNNQDLNMMDADFEADMEELDLDDLEQAAGGKKTVKAGHIYVVKGVTNYLAVRRTPKYTDSNIIAKLHNGEKVVIVADFGGAYKLICPVSRPNVSGYVNGKFLKLVQ